jgi:lysozyme
MIVSPEGRQRIKKEEDCVLHAYLDDVGVWTIGWGNTHYEDGTSVKKGDVISQGRADGLFDKTLDRMTEKILPSLNHAPTQNQLDAIMCFTYNVGVGQKKNAKGEDGSGFLGSTLREIINTGGSCPEVTEQFGRWNKGRVNGKVVVLAGLTKRRAREAALYCK